MAWDINDMESAGLLPKEISDEIFTTVDRRSTVARLSQNERVEIGTETFIPVSDDVPRAQVWEEGQLREASDYSLRTVAIEPVRVQVGIELSDLAVRTNSPSKTLADVQRKLSNAISNQIDLAVFHGRQELGAKKLTRFTGLYDQIDLIDGVQEGDDTISAQGIEDVAWDAYDQIIGNQFGRTPNGVAFDSTVHSVFGRARTPQGARLYPDLNLNGNELMNFSGLNASFNSTVSGRVAGMADTGLRAIVGDFSALRYGVSSAISFRKETTGDPLGKGDLVRRGMVAYIADFNFGFAIVSPESFVGIVDPSKAGDKPAGGGASTPAA